MALAIDTFGNASNGTGVTSLAVGGSLTITAGDILFMQVSICHSSTAPSVSSISDTGSTTWAKRASGIFTNNQFGGTFGRCETWWAYCPNHQTSYTATIHLSAAPDVVVGSFIAVKGFTGSAYTTAPFDPNVAIPNVQTAATNTDPSASITTTLANTMLIGACATGTNAVNGAGSGYTNSAGGLFSFGNGVSDGVGSFIQQQTVSGTQSGASNTVALASDGWCMIGDALSQTGNMVGAPHQMPSMGYG